MGRIIATCGHEVESLDKIKARYFVEWFPKEHKEVIVCVASCLNCCRKNRKWLFAKEETARRHLNETQTRGIS